MSEQDFHPILLNAIDRVYAARLDEDSSDSPLEMLELVDLCRLHPSAAGGHTRDLLALSQHRSRGVRSGVMEICAILLPEHAELASVVLDGLHDTYVWTCINASRALRNAPIQGDELVNALRGAFDHAVQMRDDYILTTNQWDDLDPDVLVKLVFAIGNTVVIFAAKGMLDETTVRDLLEYADQTWMQGGLKAENDVRYSNVNWSNENRRREYLGRWILDWLHVEPQMDLRALTARFDEETLRDDFRPGWPLLFARLWPERS